MGSVITFADDFTSPVPAKKLFKALILDAPNLLPKLLPQVVSIEIIEGDGGPGSITKMTYNEGGELKHVKHRIDGLDTEKLTHSYTLIEGDALDDKNESIAFEIKFEATVDGGCKGTSVSKFHPKPGFEIKEDEVKKGKEKAAALFKAVEAYLIANPEAYA
ncbi:hypothetical protein JCGZ_18938 [Jatropha curcas]|uniref:Bet v I/Major latex protein domain-containing protein n=1 Tax=Jatropha curcas TaxID=180498 RepID=A0A067JYJ6_JATCU|nr:hypothetical protein JCGZ_18938 [Jatropha curcas]